MTDVASLERCKELYELSGWQDVEQYWEYYPSTKDALLKKNAPGNVFPDEKLLPDLITPAYGLGYLLRKLPTEIKEHYLTLEICVEHEVSGEWTADYLQYPNIYLLGKDNPDITHSDTPEDAACKLTIELIKQGVLKP